MEKEAIIYVCEGKEPLTGIGSFRRFVSKPPVLREVSFMDQNVVCVRIPLRRADGDAAFQRTGKTKRPGHVFSKIIDWYYCKKVQRKLWDVLLTCQNNSLQPAFCSPAVYRYFCQTEMLKRELWLTTDFPPVLTELALLRFLERDCVFRKQTRVFVVDGGEIPVQDMIYPYCGRLNYLQFFTTDKQKYDAFINEVYEESGLAISVTTQAENVRDADIVIDLGRQQIFDGSDIKKGSVYFDAYSKASFAEDTIRNRKDIFYFSTAGYWERIVGNM